ncbi:MAG: hypothetical protein ACFE8V_05395 [Promethearchaeota archaeon]
MSKRIVIASVLLVVMGSGLITGGILIKDYINEQVVNSVDEGLLGIEEEALPMIESMIAELGIPRTLRDIRKIGLTETEAIVNATFFMFLINMTLHEPSVLGVVPLELLFDRWIQWVLIIPVTYSSSLQGMGYPPIKGISEYHQQNLWYGNAKYFLINGADTLPGLVGNNTLGTGVLEFLELYDNANGNPILEQELAVGYNTTWIKLTKLIEYYRDYFVPIAIPMLVANLSTIMPKYSGMNTKDIAEMFFFMQWANCSLFETGIDLSSMVDDLEEPLYGFEVSRFNPSNITLSSIYSLWDDNDIKAITNDTGINEWIIAINNITKQQELGEYFRLQPYQISMLLNWLWVESFKWNIVPVLILLPPPLGEGMTLSEFARNIFLEVWTNGTADGKRLYPYGFPLKLKAGTIYGFEIGYRDQSHPVIPTNISLESAKSLWNFSNPYSLVSSIGLKDWYYALDNPNSAITYGLQLANQLTSNQIKMIFVWLPKFRDNIMPFLAQEDQNLPMDSTTLGNVIMIGTIVPGGILISLSITAISRNLGKKRRLKT